MCHVNEYDYVAEKIKIQILEIREIDMCNY